MLLPQAATRFGCFEIVPGTRIKTHLFSTDIQVLHVH